MATLMKPVKKNYTKGSVIFSQGDTSDNVYIIQKGKVTADIVIDDKTVINLGVFGQNDFFGEMSMFGSRIRTATVKAIEDTTVLVINQQVLKNQMSKLPSWFYSMFVAIVDRLKKTNEMVVQMKLDEAKRVSKED